MKTCVVSHHRNHLVCFSEAVQMRDHNEYQVKLTQLKKQIAKFTSSQFAKNLSSKLYDIENSENRGQHSGSR